MGEPAKPHNRFEIAVTASGPTWEDAWRNFDEAYCELKRHGSECSMVQGSPSGTAVVSVVEDPQMTPERHAKELSAYVEWLKHREERA